MEWREFSAKTVDDAILEAAIKLGTTRDNVDYEVVFQGSSGFLGIGSKDAIIRARLKEEEEDILEEIKNDLKLEKPFEKNAGPYITQASCPPTWTSVISPFLL